MNLCDFCSQPIPTLRDGITHDKTFTTCKPGGVSVSVHLSFTIPIAHGTMGASICSMCARTMVSAMIPSPTVDRLEMLKPSETERLEYFARPRKGD